MSYLKRTIKEWYGTAVLIQNVNNLFEKLLKYYKAKNIEMLSDANKAEALLLLIEGDCSYGN